MAWTLIKELETKGGHHYYTSEDYAGRVAVADNSMGRWGDPTTTDDGLMWVNDPKIRDGYIEGEGATHGLSFSIPVVKERGGSGFWTGADLAEATALAKYFNAKLVLYYKDKTYRIEEE